LIACDSRLFPHRRDVFLAFRDYFAALDREHVLIVALDSKHHVLGYHVVKRRRRERGAGASARVFQGGTAGERREYRARAQPSQWRSGAVGGRYGGDHATPTGW
jgi:hypothetical protein